MQFDSARNAKADIFLNAFGYVEAAMPMSDVDATPLFVPKANDGLPRRTGAGRLAKRVSPGAMESTESEADAAGPQQAKSPKLLKRIAVGIRPGERGASRGGSRLQLFLQDRRLESHPVVEKARSIAKNEIDVHVTGVARFQARRRPLDPGCSVGHPDITAGTLGFFATHPAAGPGFVSNNHVLAAVNRARAGDRILQPARKDGGNVAKDGDWIGDLLHFEPLRIGEGEMNFVDAAFATLRAGTAYVASRIDLNGATLQLGAPAPTDGLLPDEQIVKRGRTTGVTRGRIVATDVDNLVVYYRDGGADVPVRFDRQITADGVSGRFSFAGDSGSLIALEDGSPIGLLYAGTQIGGRNGGGVTYINPIMPVLETLGVVFLSQDGGQG